MALRLENLSRKTATMMFEAPVDGKVLCKTTLAWKMRICLGMRMESLQTLQRKSVKCAECAERA